MEFYRFVLESHLPSVYGLVRLSCTSWSLWRYLEWRYFGGAWPPTVFSAATNPSVFEYELRCDPRRQQSRRLEISWRVSWRHLELGAHESATQYTEKVHNSPVSIGSSVVISCHWNKVSGLTASIGTNQGWSQSATTTCKKCNMGFNMPKNAREHEVSCDADVGHCKAEDNEHCHEPINFKLNNLDTNE